VTHVAGNIGSGERLSYALVGDAVNVASRIQALNKELGTTVLLSGATCARLGSTSGCRSLPDMQVKGHRAAMSIYALD
jgi:adenylate cyclase